MTSTSRIRVVLASLLMLAMFAISTGPRAFANTQSNTVTFNVSGGNVTAIATCLNAAGNGSMNSQVNDCNNYAYARGNVIVIRGVHINAVQANGATVGTPAQSNSLNFTVSGGNVTSVATCINKAARGSGNLQLNTCVNTAIAIGNIIVLINVHIDSTQVNG